MRKYKSFHFYDSMRHQNFFSSDLSHQRGKSVFLIHMLLCGLNLWIRREMPGLEGSSIQVSWMTLRSLRSVCFVSRWDANGKKGHTVFSKGDPSINVESRPRPWSPWCYAHPSLILTHCPCLLRFFSATLWDFLHSCHSVKAQRAGGWPLKSLES